MILTFQSNMSPVPARLADNIGRWTVAAVDKLGEQFHSLTQAAGPESSKKTRLFLLFPLKLCSCVLEPHLDGLFNILNSHIHCKLPVGQCICCIAGPLHAFITKGISYVNILQDWLYMAKVPQFYVVFHFSVFFAKTWQV